MISVPDKSFTLAGPMYAARHPSTRTHLASFCAGERDNGKALYQQNNSLKNEMCASGPKAGNSGVVKLAGFYSCLLEGIGNDADQPKKKGRISSPTPWLLTEIHSACLLRCCCFDSSASLRAFSASSSTVSSGINSLASCIFASPSLTLVFSGSLLISNSFPDETGKDSIAQSGGLFFDLLRCRRCSSSRATVMICWIFSPALTPISSTRVSASREDSSKASSLPSDCLRAISPCIAETIKPAVDSSVCFTASIATKTSCGTLAVTDCDLLFFEPVAIAAASGNWCKTVYTKSNYIKALTCKPPLIINTYTLSTGRKQVRHKNSEARKCYNTNGPLTTSVITSNEVAMSNRITPLTGRASLSPNLFLWRFLALNRHDKKARPCRLSVEAATEREARRILAPHFILSLAARLPVREVRHA